MMGNPLSRFFNLILHPSSSRTTGLLVLLVIALSIPLTVFVAQKQQETRQQAAELVEECVDVPVAIERCLYPDTMPSNCSPGGNLNCQALPRVADRPDPVSSICGESEKRCTEQKKVIRPGSDATPQLQDTCTQNGGTCVGTPDACDRIGSPAFGTCPSGGPSICCKRNPNLGGASNPYTSPGSSSEVPCGNNGVCRAGVCVVGPERDTIDPNGSVDCGTGSSGSTSGCKSGETCVSNEIQCEGKICTPSGKSCNGGVCYKISTSTCGAAYSGSCTNTGERIEPPCQKTCPDGKTVTGISVKVCQTIGSDRCWYDQYADSTKSQSERNAGCYATCPAGGTTPTTPPSTGQAPATGGLPTGIAISCPGVDPVCSSGHVAIKLVSGNWVCSNTTTGNFVTSPAPTCPSAVSGATKLSFTIGLDGLGSTGDYKNPNPEPTSSASKGSNKNPNRPTKTFFYQVFDSAGTTVKEEGQGLITFESASGKFKATADLKNALPDGTYLLKVRAQGYLAKIIKNVTVANKNANVPPTNLATGDTDGNNNLSILDYNTVMGCLFKPATGNCQTADLDDDGNVTQFDYNLFIREFSAIQQGE